jgi:6-phosphogluconolactonase
VYVSGYGPNIHLLEQDLTTGQLTERSKISGGSSPSYMAFSPDKRFAYAINEADGADSKVLAFQIDPKDGQLSPLNSQSSGGSGSPHLAVHPSGKWLVVAHYNSGEVTVLPIAADGRLGAAGAPDRGPQHDCENAHQAVFDASGDYLLVPCLGSDYVLQYRFSAGALSYNEPATVEVKGGPRHLALDPTEKRAYVLTEYASTIVWFDYDKSKGTLTQPQMIESFDQQAGSSAHIVVHPNGKWLYASNRKENSLGLFAIAGDGAPSAVSFERNMLATPRDFSIDPSGQWLILANQEGEQTVLVYGIGAQDGKLSLVQKIANNDKPTFTRALRLP